MMMLRQIANRLGKGSVNKQFTRTNRQYNRTFAAGPKRLSASQVKKQLETIKEKQNVSIYKQQYIYIYIHIHIHINFN